METVEDCQKAPDLPKNLSTDSNLTGIYKRPLDEEANIDKPLEANGSQTVYDYLIHSPVSNEEM